MIPRLFGSMIFVYCALKDLSTKSEPRASDDLMDILGGMSPELSYTNVKFLMN